jgi:hypothetical protein
MIDQETVKHDPFVVLLFASAENHNEINIPNASITANKLIVLAILLI